MKWGVDSTQSDPVEGGCAPMSIHAITVDPICDLTELKVHKGMILQWPH